MTSKILIVDDDNDFRKEFKECLEEYDVIDVPRGEDAIRLLKRPNEIDLVTLDVRMPEMSGLDVLKEIRRLAPDIGIVMITGHSSKDVALESLRGHADDYIEKPVNVDKTKEIIEKVICSRRGHPALNDLEIKDKIDKVKQFTERNITKSVRLKDAAASVCLSPKYLSRIFRQSTGMRFSEYRLKLAVAKAKKMLKESAYNVNQVAYNLGYQNAESFIRLFKSITGRTPTEYRMGAQRQTGKRKGEKRLSSRQKGNIRRLRYDKIPA